jgi:hypothetical protein
MFLACVFPGWRSCCRGAPEGDRFSCQCRRGLGGGRGVGSLGISFCRMVGFAGGDMRPLGVLVDRLGCTVVG